MHTCVYGMFMYVCTLHISLAVAILDDVGDVLENIDIIEKQKVPIVLCCTLGLSDYRDSIHYRDSLRLFMNKIPYSAKCWQRKTLANQQKLHWRRKLWRITYL